MKLGDLQNNIANSGLQQAHMGDTRKPKLTLRHVKKLRRIRELKELERANQSKQLELIYGTLGQTDENPGF